MCVSKGCLAIADKDEAGPSGAAAPFVAESKLKALLADLEKTREEDPTAKVSQ